MSVEIFCCYSREDQALLNELRKHLSSLQRQNIISIWNDTNISPGSNYEEEIAIHLKTANIILLLVSPDFMASEYCYSIEMQRAMIRHNHGEALVIPIILRPVIWQQAPFGKIQVLPQDGKPIIGRYWHSSDEAFVDVVEGIRKAIEKLNSKPSIPLSSKPFDTGTIAVSGTNTHRNNDTIIDLSIKAAYVIPSHQHPFSLADLHAAYLQTNPGIKTGTTLASFGATINYHTINMRSRFPDPGHKRKPASWLSRPVYKRVERGRYMLLSREEIALFRQRVDEGDPRIYEDEYDIDDLI